jgi:uncharacterized delta-60 repeat protein
VTPRRHAAASWPATGPPDATSVCRAGFHERLALLSLALACCAFGAVDKREEVVTREPPPRVHVAEVLRAPAGGFYVVANSRRSRYDVYGGSLVLVRYDRRGRPLPSFGERGVYRTRWPGRPVRALAATRQRDGKLVVVGSIDHGDERDLFIGRFYDDGTLDGAFGTNGVQTVDLNDFEEAGAVAVQPDGAIVVAATTDTPRRYTDTLPEMALVRLRPDGALDGAFGEAGVVRFPPHSDCAYERAQALVLAGDGTILVGGNWGAYCPRPDGTFSAQVARVASDGRDSRVVDVPGTGGYTRLLDMTISPRDDRLYVAGSVYDDVYGRSRMWAAALDPGLEIDRAYGTRGEAFVDFPGTELDQAAALTLDRRGRVVLAGSTFRLNGDRTPFAVARLTRSGVADLTFGRRGMTRIRFGTRTTAVADVMEQSRGRLLVAGASGRVSPDRMVALARLKAGGRP